MKFEIDDTFRIPIISGPKKCHVRGIVDGRVVFRWWNRYKQRWVYEVDEMWLLEHRIKSWAEWEKTKK